MKKKMKIAERKQATKTTRKPEKAVIRKLATGIPGQENPIFTVADGLLWLSQVMECNSVVRKLQSTNCGVRRSVPGLHTFRITENGLQTFSRTGPPNVCACPSAFSKRIN